MKDWKKRGKELNFKERNCFFVFFSLFVICLLEILMIRIFFITHFELSTIYQRFHENAKRTLFLYDCFFKREKCPILIFDKNIDIPPIKNQVKLKEEKNPIFNGNY